MDYNFQAYPNVEHIPINWSNSSSLSLPMFLKDYSDNISTIDDNYVNRVNTVWHNGWDDVIKTNHTYNNDMFDYTSKANVNEDREVPNEGSFVESLRMFHSHNTNDSLRMDTDLSPMPECQDMQHDVPEQQLTFSSPESAFYEYQRKMERQLCQVCGESAAGFHHGAYVCEACKKFFMRHHLNRTTFTLPCPTGGKCALLKSGRIKCQSCRFKKCLNVGMTLHNPNGSQNRFDISRIPCRVCGGKSSGFHFGALTCEGCKGFFRRAEGISQSLLCTTGFNDCLLTGINSRNVCKSCRFKRCLEVGMSKKGSRIGRQPNAVKFHCILEIMKKSHDKPTPWNMPTLSDQAGDVLTLSKLQSNIKTDDIDNYKDYFSILPISEVFETNEEKLHFIASIKEASRIVEISKRNLQQLSCRNWPLYNCQSLNDMWRQMMNYFDVHSAMIVQFAKAIPGFNKFELKDRRGLVQDAMYPIMLLRLGSDYEAEKDEYNYFDFSVVDRETILNNFKSFSKITEHLIAVSRLLYSLTLSNYDISLLCLIEMMKNYTFLDNHEDGLKILRQARSLLWQSLEDEATLECETSSVSFVKMIPTKSFHRYKLIFEDLTHMLTTMNQEHVGIIHELRNSNTSLEFPELYIDMFKMQATDN